MKINELLNQEVPPAIMLDAVIEDADNLNLKQYATGAKTKLVRECWQAAVFGIGYQSYVEPCRIIVLGGTDSFDFQVVTADGTIDFESVMVVEEGRRMGNELREADEQISQGKEPQKKIMPEQISANKKSLPEKICTEANKKYAKWTKKNPYINLLIYIDINVGEINLNELREKCQEIATNFQSVWIISANFIATLYMDTFCILKPINGFAEFKIKSPNKRIKLIVPG